MIRPALLLPLALFLFLSLPLRDGSECGPIMGIFTMNDDLATILNSSQDPRELARTAIGIARSNIPEDHQLLFRSLTSESFLNRLNAPAEYSGDARKLRLYRILDALSRNPGPSAREVLMGLTDNRVFTKEGSRIEALIIASAEIRPAPKALVAFWDRYSQPDDGFTPLAISAMVANGSPPALGLFERKMADPKHEDDYKTAWMRSDVVTHRNSPELLGICQNLLEGGLPAGLRSELVEVLFDYKPGVWYPPASVHNPPPWSSYSPAAKAQLEKIGRYALAGVDLSPVTKAVVEGTLKEIRKETNRDK